LEIIKLKIMKWLFIILTLFTTLAIVTDIKAADTNTVSSTVVTNNTPPTASAPSVVVNNSDVCKTAASAAIQTQILGLASGMTVTDENCERIKLSRSLYGMGMKVAAVSTLCQDPRVFDAMWMSGTPCPYMGDIGDAAKVSWEKNLERIPKKSLIYAQLKDIKVEINEEKKDEKKKSKHSIVPMVITTLALGIAF
tara:strand:- start:1284 stop:1868 length:585 start_codon:yes stop_codon:yes gene_type:complete